MYPQPEWLAASIESAWRQVHRRWEASLWHYSLLLSNLNSFQDTLGCPREAKRVAKNRPWWTWS